MTAGGAFAKLEVTGLSSFGHGFISSSSVWCRNIKTPRQLGLGDAELRSKHQCAEG